MSRLMKNFALVAVASAVVACVSSTASAALVNNGNFSGGTNANNQYGDTNTAGSFNNINAWTATALSGFGWWGTNLSSISSPLNQPGIGVTHFAYLRNANLTSQALTTGQLAFIPGDILRLSIDARSDTSATSVVISLLFFDGTNANGSASSLALVLPASFTSSPLVPLSFDAIAPANTTRVAARVSVANSDIIFDNVDISIVPEPASIAAVGLSMLILLRRQR